MKKSIAVMLIALLFLSSLAACDIGDFRFLEGSVFSSLGAQGGVDDFHKEQEMKAARELCRKLGGQEICLSPETHGEGRFVVPITTKEIAAEIERKFGVTIDKRKIETPEIKQLGTYDFKVDCGYNSIAKMKLVVK